MVGWLYPLDRQEFEQALGAGDVEGSLMCCSTWGHKESGRTQRLNSPDDILSPYFFLQVMFQPIDKAEQSMTVNLMVYGPDRNEKQ